MHLIFHHIKNSTVIFCFLLTGVASAQLQVNQQDVNSLVRSILLCDNIPLTNITFSGNNQMIGHFNGSKSNVGLSNGIIISTGNITDAIGPNNDPASGSGMGFSGDPDLNAIAGSPTYDAAILEFDFIAMTDSVDINYVFASEEYPEFVNKVNDVFGFFLSGPGISGQYSNNSINIALTPGTSKAVSINNINAGVNANLYVNNGDGSSGNSYTDKKAIQFNGFTKPMVARYPLIIGQKYHIKIAIADAKDGVYDSAVFLEGGNFFSDNFTFHQIATNSLTNLYEGCDSVIINIKMSSSKYKIGKLPIKISGTAVNGIDYSATLDSLVVNPNTGEASFKIVPLKDNSIDDGEYVDIIMQKSVCKPDTLHYVFRDLLPLTVTNYDSIYCGDAIINISAKYSGGASSAITWTADGSHNKTIAVNPGWNSKDYFFTVDDHCKQGPVQGKVQVIVNNKKPDAGINQRYCSGPSAFIGNTANAGYTYSWSPIAGLNDPALSQPTVSLTNTSGTKNVINYVVESDNGMCKAKDTVIVTVLPNPIAVIDSQPYVHCPVFFLNPKENSLAADSSEYYWSTSEGQQKTGKNAVLTFANSGFFDVYLTMTNYGMCSDKDTAVNHVEVLIAPTADFTVSANEVDMLYPTVIFTGNPLLADSCYMDIIGPKGELLNASPLCDFTYDIPKSGYNKAIQYVVAQNGCRDTLEKTIYVKPEYFVYAPNAFTINGDGLNEEYKVSYSWAIEDFDFSIYDRWGHVIFHQTGNGSEISWDGRAPDGTIQPIGVYVYKYTYTKPVHGELEEKVQEYGKITLLR